jgi:hypothetical protein
MPGRWPASSQLKTPGNFGLVLTIVLWASCPGRTGARSMSAPSASRAASQRDQVLAGRLDASLDLAQLAFAVVDNPGKASEAPRLATRKGHGPAEIDGLSSPIGL